MWDMPSMRRVSAGFLVMAVLAGARPASAYREAHMTADDVRVTVDDAAVARIDHALTVRVLSGTLKTLDVSGIEPEAKPDAEASITSESGRASSAAVDTVGEHVLRLTIAEPKGLPRGTYVVHVRYQVDLVKARELLADGAMWKLAWTAPMALEGYDAARVTFDLPAAPTEPRPLSADGTTSDDGRLATLRRTAERDELELVRPHVARGESPTWALRVDPKAFAAVHDPALRPPPPAAPPRPDHFADVGALAALALVALAFGLLVAQKDRGVAAACAARGIAPSPLVRLSRAWSRAPLAGVAFAAGVGAELLGAPTVGALAIASAMALATHRAPPARPAVRGPGKWLALAPSEAFDVETRGDALDIGSARGRFVAATVALLVVAAAGILRRFDAEWPYLVVMDALALVPIFVTGTARQLPPDMATAPARTLAALHRALKKDKAVRIAPWARVPLGCDHADELRLLVLPRAAMPGLGGIEVGQTWQRTANGYLPVTEVLVRVHDATAAAARMTALAPFARAVPGRRPDERVVRLAPAFPARRATVALVRRIARELVDRRACLTSSTTFRGAERRAPANKRTARSRADRAAA